MSKKQYKLVEGLLSTVVPQHPQRTGSGTCPGYQSLQVPKSHSWPSVSEVPHPQIQPTSDCVVLYIFVGKTLRVRWTHAVQTPAVQELAVYYFLADRV